MNRILQSKSLWVVVILLIFSAVSVQYATSESSGITGVSKTGCTQGGCHHALTASAATSVAVSTAATALAPSKQYDFRIVVHNSTAKYAGCDISVDGGTLALAGTGTGLFLSRRELTHNTPRKFTGDSVVWNFRWTAPATPGTYHIYAAGNAVNGNGIDDSGDLWNVTVLPLTVATSGVAEAPSVSLQMYPNPVQRTLNVQSSTQIGSYSIVDAAGVSVANAESRSNALSIDVSRLDQGAYWLRLLNADGTTSVKRFVVVR